MSFVDAESMVNDVAAVSGVADENETAPVSVEKSPAEKMAELLQGCTVQDILAAKEHVDAILKNRIEADYQAMRANAEAIAVATGVNVEKVLESLLPPAKKRTRKSSEEKNVVERVKYQHPENTELKWSGRGKTPKWLEEAFEQFGEEACIPG
jgi:DNA-binding protein H-NS